MHASRSSSGRRRQGEPSLESPSLGVRGAAGSNEWPTRNGVLVRVVKEGKGKKHGNIRVSKMGRATLIWISLFFLLVVIFYDINIWVRPEAWWKKPWNWMQVLPMDVFEITEPKFLST